MFKISKKLLLIILIKCLILSKQVNSFKTSDIFHPIKMLSNAANMLNNLTHYAIDEVAETRAVFKRYRANLNCLGIPMRTFAYAIDAILADKTKAEDVKFYFASQKQPKYVIVRNGDTFTLDGTNFDITRDTILLVHGFMSSGLEEWLRDMKDALLKYDDVNLIVVDWQKGSNTWNYLEAAANAKIVGEEIAKLFAQIRQLIFSMGSIDIENHWGKIHFVGHSLGSHIAARGAFGIKKSQEGREQAWIVNRITGLDPAQPCYVTTDMSLKLDKDDAPYVDVIHSNARHLIFLGLGTPEPSGYIDFYPNGGQMQPGCSNIIPSIWRALSLPQELIKASICSHGRAYEFFTESIRNALAGNCTFIGHKWDRTYKNVEKLLEKYCENDDCYEMGINSINSFPHNNGTYFVSTGDIQPFCNVRYLQKLKIKEQLRSDQNLEKSFLSRIGDSIFG